MELKEVLGNRRTIRFYLPFKPVEREKILKMMEAARRASCVGNVNATNAIIIWRDKASPELLQALTPALGYQQMQTAPCFILWYQNTMAYEVSKWIQNLLDLADTGRVGMGDMGGTKEQIDKLLRAVFTPIWKQAAVSPLAFMDVGQAIAQATLVAYDEGLGTCCMSGPSVEQVAKLLKLPETAVPVCLMSVGYSAESPEAGGQTVKAPFEQLFFEMEYGRPLKEDPQVVEELEREKMIQQPAPLPWRQEELRYLRDALKLMPEGAIGQEMRGGSQQT
ncbi:MAG: nitroreductase family protein [Dehalococcoidia bacterium]